jgi:WD40 repeat protein
MSENSPTNVDDLRQRPFEGDLRKSTDIYQRGLIDVKNLRPTQPHKANGVKFRRTRTHSGAWSAGIDISADSRSAYHSCERGFTRIDLASGVETRHFDLRTRKGGWSNASAIACSPRGTFVASGDWEGQILIWRAIDGRLRNIVRLEFEDKVQRIVWAHDEKTVFVTQKIYIDETSDQVGIGYRTIRVNVETKASVAEGSFSVICISPLGNAAILANIEDDNCFAVVPLIDGEPDWSDPKWIDGMYDEPFLARFSRQGHCVLGINDSSIQIWCLSTGILLFTIVIPDVRVRAFEYCETAGLLYFVQGDGTISLWSRHSQRVVEVISSATIGNHLFSHIYSGKLLWSEGGVFATCIGLHGISHVDLVAKRIRWQYPLGVPRAEIAVSVNDEKIAFSVLEFIAVVDVVTGIPVNFIKGAQFATFRNSAFINADSQLTAWEFLDRKPEVRRKDSPPPQLRKWDMATGSSIASTNHAAGPKDRLLNGPKGLLFLDVNEAIPVLRDAISGQVQLGLTELGSLRKFALIRSSSSRNHLIVGIDDTSDGSNPWLSNRLMVWDLLLGTFIGEFSDGREIVTADICSSGLRLVALTFQWGAVEWNVKLPDCPKVLKIDGSIYPRNAVGTAAIHADSSMAYAESILYPRIRIMNLHSDDPKSWGASIDQVAFNSQAQFLQSASIVVRVSEEQVLEAWSVSTGMRIWCLAMDGPESWVWWNQRGQWRGCGEILDSIVSTETYVEQPHFIDTENWYPRPVKLLEFPASFRFALPSVTR